MSVEEVFQNLNDNELQQAQNWLAHLRRPEIPRIEDALRLLNGEKFYLRDLDYKEQTSIAAIAAGSSVDTTSYTDIDLFLLAQSSLHDSELSQGTSFNQHTILRQGLGGELPNYVVYAQYGGHELMKPIKRAWREEVGAMVTITLFHQLEGFEARRPGRTDDLLMPPTPMGAEGIIGYNRNQCSKFLVLSRQYKPNL